MKRKAKIIGDGPVYLRIAADIKNTVQSGELKPGDNIMPERKLAEFYQVSYGTLRKAIEVLVAENLLTKVQGSGVFVTKDKPASSTPADRPIRIGINVPTLKLSYYTAMVEVMEQMIIDNHYEFFLIRGDLGRKSKQNRLENILQRTKLDGLILVGEIMTEQFNSIRQIAPEMKMIFLDGTVNGEEVDFIKFDDESGAFSATEHLIRQGGKKILFIDGCSFFINPGLREKGYLAAMERYNLEPWVKYGTGFDYESGYNAMQEIIDSGRMPDAIFCVTDLVAMGAMQALSNHQFRVPEQLLVAGFSDLREADFTHPRISSVKVDVKEISRLAVLEMFDKIAGRSKSRWQVIFPTHLIVRASSTPKPKPFAKQTRQSHNNIVIRKLEPEPVLA
ncbi:MAG: GntR family transcriptional regulator [Victivallaceae bacterium]|nr:GntR family transcriptional regulator [Victivallaceae bacterium]